MKKVRLVVLVFLFGNICPAFGQKALSEGTITYNITIQQKDDVAKTKTGSRLDGSKSTVYLKGVMSRTDMTSSLGNESTIYNAKTGSAAILKEYSGQKLMITLTKDNWDTRNQRFDGINFENTSETKVIEGYNCKRAVARLKDGSSISVYYAPDLIVLNKDYNQAFKTLPGFPIEYEIETNKLIITYSLISIDLSPLPAAKFEFPTSGYRVMTYDENKKGKTGV